MGVENIDSWDHFRIELEYRKQSRGPAFSKVTSNPDIQLQVKGQFYKEEWKQEDILWKGECPSEQGIYQTSYWSACLSQMVNLVENSQFWKQTQMRSLSFLPWKQIMMTYWGSPSVHQGNLEQEKTPSFILTSQVTYCYFWQALSLPFLPSLSWLIFVWKCGLTPLPSQSTS